MSEYQFYEFLSIDRPLTTKDQQEIQGWSSRTSPTPTGATFIYNYGDFPKSPKQVVGKYFDAMFHIANWGTKWLLLKFPKELLDHGAVQDYCTVEEISLSEYGEYFVLEILFSEEEGYAWLDGEGFLSSLIGLRRDILNGDYRSLYIAWLHACSNAREWDEFDTTALEPVLSLPLKPFNDALKSWVELLEIDQDLLSIVSEKQILSPENTLDLMTDEINLLSDDEKTNFLKRLLHEEPLLSVKFRKRLKKLSVSSDIRTTSSSHRTIEEIFHKADHIKEQRQELERQKRKKKKLQKLEMIEAEEETLWKNVHGHISRKNSKAYDAAIAILNDLFLLAKHRGTQAEYKQGIQSLLKKYPRLSSLKSKITHAKLF